MDNFILQLEFAKILLITNAFDQFLALKAFKQKYKTSVFYHTTHYSVFKAFTIFKQHKITTFISEVAKLIEPEFLAAKINTVCENLDQTALQHLYEQIITAFNTDGLQNQKTELMALLNKIQK